MEFVNIEKTINSFIDKKYFKNAAIRIAKDKKIIYSKQFGYNDQNNTILLKGDEIYQAYSMTKPITTLAALLLIDKKLISLDDDLSKYIPSFKNKNIKIWNLLTMTSGLTYSGNKSNTQLQIKKVLDDWKINNYTLEQLCDELSKVDLLFIPSTNWYYGLSLDVLSRVIEVVSNKSYRDFVKEEIFNKLNMNDSDYYLFDKNRKANVFRWTYKDDQNQLDQVENFDFLFQSIDKLPVCNLGGSGLFTTADDYLKFLNVLIDGKLQNGDQLISLDLLNQMKSDQLTKNNLKQFFNWNLNEDYSYGFGGRVRIKNQLYPLTEVGEYGWDGLLGSSGLVDTKNKITMTIMLSSHPGHNKLVETEFFDALYQDLRLNNLA
ncbi:serine hydrolase domain-containing protein [Mycoplasma mycoides]|uniref:serine hydrolase domain-containing protein n=1 Tax=Mycoplasma mycoides TaxID=2102 RepID=UPI00273495BF|nr:serine hydrolase domain-containing protein [Mycoplasma mycoides]MDP4040526.1 serine hydrolase domain-containing protein [Mycoplasma mycoides]MDP4041347.1 serine hydrolase domain-containing protein [Mycoplasma mycoides]MDP4042339.1 serine hydrolase domain-containing protein [Mycoplasma mycoides]MDP4043741.1 serine hydrolase domain-containing protein [Mycoplasma mycoides]MDP4044608.1 serine hydrolase domain-containing protein [Mycoplasma mycoides]